MSFFICPHCQTAGETWAKLRGHIMGAHKAEGEIPKREAVEEVDELPEGYRLIGKKEKPIEKAELPSEIAPPEEVSVPEEIPEEFTDRVKLSLNVHNFPEKLKTQIINVLALHPETHDNPNNFGNLLAHICSTYPGGNAHARKIPLIVSEVFGQPSAEIPYAGSYGTTPQSSWYAGLQQPYAGIYGGQPAQHAEDPITRWINYQIWKESKEEEKVKETKLPPAVDTKLSEMERWYKETREDLGAVLNRLDKQERAEEEAKREAQIAELRAEIRALGESKRGGDENNWLKLFLEERDKREDEAKKRLEDIIREQSSKLAEATRELTATRKEVDARVIEATKREAEIRQEVLKDLKAGGWAPKTKTKEELDHELQEQFLQIIPEKIDKGFDRIADKIVPSATQASATSSAERLQKPRSVQEIAEQTKIEDEIINEMKRRG